MISTISTTASSSSLPPLHLPPLLHHHGFMSHHQQLLQEAFSWCLALFWQAEAQGLATGDGVSSLLPPPSSSSYSSMKASVFNNNKGVVYLLLDAYSSPPVTYIIINSFPLHLSSQEDTAAAESSNLPHNCSRNIVLLFSLINTAQRALPQS